MADDPLDQYGSSSVMGENFMTYRPPIPTLAGTIPRPIRSGPVKAEPPPPAEARSYRPSLGDQTRDALEAIGANPRSAATVGRLMPWTPAQPIFEGGQLLGEAAQNRSRGTELLGLGSIALGAVPLPLPAPARRVGALVRREPPPITGHNIGSLSIPRVPRDVDPALGLYSAADEAARSYPRTGGTARDIQDWMASQGVTANEMAARGLTDLFRSPQQVITRQQLLTHLGENPIQVRATTYQGTPVYNVVRIEDGAVMRGPLASEADAWSELRGSFHRPQNYQVVRSDEIPRPARYGPDQYPDLSLNAAGNPTYQESVLYAPPRQPISFEQYRTNFHRRYPDTGFSDDDLRRMYEEVHGNRHLFPDAGLPRSSPQQQRSFVDQHYPNEPNPIGWIRSSQQEAFERGPRGEADVTRPVRGVLWDELQMPMAQRIRDEGARNEASLVRARSRVEDLTRQYNAATSDASIFMVENSAITNPIVSRLNATEQGDFVASLMAVNDHGKGTAIGQQAHDLAGRVHRAERDLALARRELATAERGIVGNPFVNETDQALRTLMHYGLQNPALRDPNISGIFLTPGALQNERYNLARHAETLGWRPTAGESHQPPYGVLYGRSPGRAPGELSTWDWQKQIQSRDELDSYIGRDLATQLLAAPEQSGLGAAHRSLNLRDATEVGGRGMRENYDRIYPETLDAILRRLDPAYPGRRMVHIRSDEPVGGTVGGARGTDAPSYYAEPVHYFPLTDRIRAQLARGLPYFAGAGAVATPALMGNEDPLQQYGGTP